MKIEKNSQRKKHNVLKQMMMNHEFDDKPEHFIRRLFLIFRIHIYASRTLFTAAVLLATFN